MEDGQAASKSLRLSPSNSIHGQSELTKDLDDDLLIEILSRIRSTRSAFQCKLVCKRWCSLMSTHYFVGRFRFRANRRMIEYDDDINSSDQSFSIIIPSPMLRLNHNIVVTMDPKNPNPYHPNRAIFALASCNDLLLCHSVSNTEEHSYYYLCNPFTKQRVALKPHPRYRKRVCGIKFGLLYELAADNYSIYRYRVVRFFLGGEVMTYHSETHKWVVQSDQRLGKEDMFGPEIIAYNGKLVWVDRKGTYLYTYDPFNTEQEQISAVDGPSLSSDRTKHTERFRVGECGGVLRIMATETFPSSSRSLKVWDLETDQDGRRSWSLKHNIPMKTIFESYKILADYPVGVVFGLKKDVVFLQSSRCLVSYNFENGKLKVEEGDREGADPIYLHSFFRLHLPWWPTPIPK